jgi:Cu(I)/Ag(I) efflux system membrane fusion protein
LRKNEADDWSNGSIRAVARPASRRRKNMTNSRFRRSRTMMAGVVAAAIGAATPALAFDAGRRVVVAQAAAEKQTGEGEGVVKGINAGSRELLVKHGPIKGSLEMMGMMMPFRVAPDVDLGKLKKGEKIKFTLSRDAKGLYVIEKVEPVE